MRTYGLALSAALMVIGSGCGHQVAMRTMPSPSAAPRSRVASPPAPVTPPAAAPAMAVRTPSPKTPLKPAKPAPRPAPTKVAVKPAAAASKGGKAYIRKPKVDSMALEQALLQEHSYIPLSFVLSLRSGNQDISDRVAAAVLYEADRANLSPSFIAAVLMVENTPMDPTAESSVGAVGLMQVMPMHEGGWGCPADLQEIEANICHGARLLHMLVQKTSGNTEMALRRYNGCLGKLVTPSCLRYPKRVMRLAASIRRDMLTVPPKVYEIAEQAPPPPPPYLRRPELLEDEFTPAPVDTLWARLAVIPGQVDTQVARTQ